jgi:hypothetical protein
MKDIELIHKIKNIKISNICKRNKLDYTNLIYGRTSKENTKLKLSDMSITLDLDSEY